MRVLASAKRRVSRILTLPVFGQIMAQIRRKVDFHGTPIDIRNPYLPLNVKAAVFWNIYESAEARLIKRWLPGELPVVELGASLGIISRLICYHRHPRFICVEANPSLIPSIHYNLDSIQGMTYSIVQKAIHYASEYVTFNWREGENLTGRIDPQGGERVECTTLSSIVKENRLDRYSLVMDIEGAEIEILMEDSMGLKQCTFIIAELHACEYKGQAYSVEEVSVLVQREGFELVGRDGNGFAFKRVEN